jgi:MinD-like ATPase involved in chromosome partitioning or flagellar assembly/tetratricopeptide (TPR) repeat protein
VGELSPEESALYIITFYSFKGGVGRTMALVNTGVELARRGRKVLLVDFDLEAPGLSTYDLLRPKKPHPGIVEYVTEFWHTLRSPLVTDFIYPREGRPIGKKGGKLWVMPAGRGDAEYRRMLNGLNWRTLYQEKEGFLLFEDTRLQWEAELHPDYVLIDARTGHTDIEGICTRQLADAVVVVFYPNEQNLAGLREVCRHIRAEETSGLKKKIKLNFVASNVPPLDDERGILRRQLAAFESELSVPRPGPVVIHREETLQMLDQPVFVLERPRSRLAREYRRLMRALIVSNPADREGALLFLRQAESRLRDRDQSSGEAPQSSPGIFGRTFLVSHWSATTALDARWRNTLRRIGLIKLEGPMLDAITLHFWNDADVLSEVARYLRSLGRHDLALRRLDRVLQLQPDRPDILLQRSEVRQKRGDLMGAAADLLHYLRLPDTSTRIVPEQIIVQLLSVSLDTLLEALSLPSLHERLLSRGGEYFWLHLVAWVLLRQQRWEDAVRYLETTADDLIGEAYRQAADDAAHAQSWRMFYLALATWGQTGTLPRDRCRQALVHFLPPGTSEDSVELAATDFQCLSLLWWGIGDSGKASALLDEAIRRLEENNESDLDGRSYWTFGETTPREFLYDCEEQRRMIRGEPVRPAFLGPQR